MPEDEKTDFEKLMDSVSQLGHIVRAYYFSLIEEGFSSKEALILTIEYQKSILALGKKP